MHALHASTDAAPQSAMTAQTVALWDELASDAMTRLGGFEKGDFSVEVAVGADSLWAILRRPDRGGLALRCAYAAGGHVTAKQVKAGHWRMKAPGGTYDVVLGFVGGERPVLRATTTLTPSVDLLIPFAPRDLYPLANSGHPREAKGNVEAAQRGLNAGLVYFTLDEPAFGTALYFQNLTALNPYFEALGTKPDGVVGGEWPELGYLPPASPLGPTPPVRPLKAGEPILVSDALLALESELPADDHEIASLFIDLLAAIYPHLDKPTPDFHDWPARARKTLRDLESPKATIEHYGHRYLHPYTASEYPDSMVQLSVLAAVNGYGRWVGAAPPMEEALRAGLGRFYDKKLGAIRRYLPNVGDDKDADAVDSWYLYHPLINLGRLALGGDAKARGLLEDSLDFAVKAAQHFKYEWPIQYKVDTFEVITACRNETGLGQTDVGGLYAYLMMLAHELFADERYLEEARRALDAMKNIGFELVYQANLSAWGAVGCLKLWRATGEERYRRQSYVFLASLMHNSPIWESEIELARHYRNFFGVTCLHDGPYMAMYEEFEVASAFDEYLAMSDNETPEAVRLLLTEYRRYALDRAWYYYPDALPAEAVAKDDIRNGHIDRQLSFPLEDLYMDGQPAGQVGQEIYGAGAAFIFTMRAFTRIDGAPFTLFCEYPLRSVIRGAPGFATVVVDGSESLECALRLIPGRKAPKRMKILIGGQEVAGQDADGSTAFAVRGGSEVQIEWRA